MAWASANRLQQAWGRIADDVVSATEPLGEAAPHNSKYLGSVSCRLRPAMAVQDRAGHEFLQPASSVASRFADVLTVAARNRSGFVRREALDRHQQKRLPLRLGQISHGRFRERKPLPGRARILRSRYSTVGDHILLLQQLVGLVKLQLRFGGKDIGNACRFFQVYEVVVADFSGSVRCTQSIDGAKSQPIEPWFNGQLLGTLMSVAQRGEHSLIQYLLRRDGIAGEPVFGLAKH